MFTRVLLTTLLCLLVLEIRLRLRKPEAIFWNGTAQQHEFQLIKNKCAARYDERLGWVSEPSRSGLPNIHGTEVTVVPPGVRANGAAATANLPGQYSVLALGDSYTFGDEVSDEQTWPAALERKASQRVYNAGGCGYGLDQMYLRGLELIPVLRPTTIIYSLTELAIPRVSMRNFSSISSVAKPYFTINREGLKLEQVPVPYSGEESLPQDQWHRLLGRSFLFDKILNRVAGNYWRNSFSSEPAVEMTPEPIDALACRIIRTIAKQQSQWGYRAVFLAQYPHLDYQAESPHVKAALKCAAQLPVGVVDTLREMQRLHRDQPEEYNKLYFGVISHMNERGNALIAELVLNQVQGENSSDRPLSSQ